MSDPLFRPPGHHTIPDLLSRPEAGHSSDDDGPRPGPQLFVEEPLGFWLRRVLMAAPCMLGALGGLIGGFIAIVFALIAAVSGKAPGSLDGSATTVRTLLVVGVVSILPAMLLAWEALLILSRRRRVRPWVAMLAFGIAATVLWSALLVAAWPGLGVALAGAIFPYTGVLAILALWRGQPDGMRGYSAGPWA
jgi:hypothetical protein